MSDTIAETHVTALDMAQNYSEFGEMIRARATAKFADWGLTITEFNVVNISFPEAVEKTIDERTNLGILSSQMGVYTQKKAADALGDAAKNQGAPGTIVGMGMGGIVNGTVAGAMSSSASTSSASKAAAVTGARFCSHCGAKVDSTAKFCASCGGKLATANTCPHCGKTVAPDAKFCPECGGKLA